MDRRFKALVALGENAVPKLIDTIESDERLTRAVEFNRDFRPDRTVLQARSVALDAVLSILHTRSLDPTQEVTYFNLEGGAENVKKVVAQLSPGLLESERRARRDARMMMKCSPIRSQSTPRRVPRGGPNADLLGQ